MASTPRRTRLVRALEQLLDIPPRPSFAPPPAQPVPNYDNLAKAITARDRREQRRQLRAEHEHAQTGGRANIDAHTDLRPLRIISDGRGANTKVYLGDHDLTGSIMALTWQLDGDGVVRCLLETEGVHLEHGPPPT
jgi:hypothetical protein